MQYLGTVRLYWSIKFCFFSQIGPAGIFNTGTNLFFQVEKENCVIKEAALSKSHSEPRKNGIRYQGTLAMHFQFNRNEASSVNLDVNNS
jgi:hypothetical protein